MVSIKSSTSSVVDDENHSLFSSVSSRQPKNYINAHHSINPDCPICLKPVFWSRHIFAIGRAWHVQCFVCSYCHKPLRPGEQSFRGGKMFCTNSCYSRLIVQDVHSQPCNHLIQQREQSDTNNNGTYLTHSLTNCLSAKEKCDICDREKISKHDHDRFPYGKLPGYAEAKKRQLKVQTDQTKKYAHSLQTANDFTALAQNYIGERCVRCTQKVFAAEFCYSMNLPWHIQCLRCAVCDRVLQPASHAVHQGLPLCAYPCYNRLFSLTGYRRGWQECRP